MPTMRLRFPGGRYHATPGGHHVNEGIVEWPPSPWRLVRSLIACGYSTQRWTSIPPGGRRLVESLSGVLPEYQLPRAALGHSRHYMPMARMKDGREETSLVLDSFAHVEDGELWVRWHVGVDDESQRLFEVLVKNLGYLGRSESWVLGESVADDTPMPATHRAYPHSDLPPAGRGFEQVMLTAPEAPASYAAWRRAALEAGLSEIGVSQGKKPTAGQQKKIDALEAAYPVDLLDCLQRDSAWWRDQKWSRPPGARAVLYWRPRSALEVGPATVARAHSEQRVESVLLALATPSGSTSALPVVARTLPQAEVVHRALVSQVGRQNGDCPELTGRDAQDGSALKGHAHAYILPLDLDADDRVDHVLVFATMGLGAVAQHALRELRKTYMKGGVGELRVAVAARGNLDQLRHLGSGLSLGVEAVLGPRGGATTWTTATPFVPPRHLKSKGRSNLEGQVVAELASRGLPEARVELLGDATVGLRHFVRRRGNRRSPPPPQDIGFAMQLTFESPVSGPICLGYASHFGLGRFEAARVG